MKFLPISLNLDNRKILIVGAGNISLSKIEKIVQFNKDITILSSKIKKEIKKISQKENLKIIKKDYEKGDIKNFDIVIVTANSLKLQKQIYKECKKSNILFSCVDLPNLCDFIFPSYLKKGDLTISISTNGASPAFSKGLKNYLDDKIPNSVGTFLEDLKKGREVLPKGKERMDFFRKKVEEYIKSWK